MLRLGYFIVCGAAFGAGTAAACGHDAFWVGLGAAIGWLWQRIAADEVKNSEYRVAWPSRPLTGRRLARPSAGPVFLQLTCQSPA